MATPNYKGPNQPSPSGGGWLASWFGGTPAYKTLDQRPAASSYGRAPAYRSAPSDAMNAQQSDACGQTPIAIVIPREVIEQ